MSPRGVIKTDSYSAELRARAIDLTQKRVLIADLRGSQQAKDLTVPPNCSGYGRIRHFSRRTIPDWPPNSLPIDPACAALGLSRSDALNAQVFQNAACNWRCWYCYVPYELLSADSKRGAWLSADDILDLYLKEPEQARVIDLSGGQPDLVPEWLQWMVEAVESRGLEKQVYLWSDDNLSNDYYWQYLTEHAREAISSARNYGRVCCFKGFDDRSFSFNTQAASDLFSRQFELFGRLMSEGIDLYAYMTFTTPYSNGIADAMTRFVDRLQELSPNLPLRAVPLEIRPYTPMQARIGPQEERALDLQRVACEAWLREIDRRFLG